ncbi:Beta-hexosaminidase-like protein [Hapsidospora chrysogenum ATCC 11550]|uniref:Beta-hexosaminidase-like protein n=1 Tax=Hapsidospora chrysogenum (strain ATCC 11550 / CBS 779.69 / DSM 880 / IAM 14645 / JCM 23072 / IMI 49137) TaxID=857340 RepID=A0A086TG97_HAPC1|nr:Beta-hexosaminidase-like protein [Hapsidospora chrysogenum ATCC 11550]
MFWSTTTFVALAAFASSASAKTKETDLSILAGQHTIYSWPSTAEPPEELLTLTRAGLVGGVILFGENIAANATPGGILALQNAYAQSPAPALIESLTGVKHAPLLIMTDQEGGYVKRIPEGGPEHSAKITGQASDLEAAGGEAGSQAADTLLGYNNNANLAPVLDVFFEEGNFIDEFERSYNNVSAKVSTAGVAFLQAMQDLGVAAAAKHFPGLGKAPQGSNTDLVPVTLEVTEEELAAVDIPPFVDAIAAGVGMIMPSWAIYPAVDPDLPAGLSSIWLKERLRGELGLEGVTVSDAIEAGSLSPFGGAGELGVLAAGAGMDLLLASARDVGQGVEVREAVAEAVASGVLDRGEFDEATERIVKLREKLGAAAARVLIPFKGPASLSWILAPLRIPPGLEPLEEGFLRHRSSNRQRPPIRHPLRQNFLLGRPDRIRMLTRIRPNSLPVLHIHLKRKPAKHPPPRPVRVHGAKPATLGYDAHDAPGHQSRLLPELAGARVQDGLVGAVDGAAGGFPAVGHAVVGSAAEEEGAVLGVED